MILKIKNIYYLNISPLEKHSQSVTNPKKKKNLCYLREIIKFKWCVNCREINNLLFNDNLNAKYHKIKYKIYINKNEIAYTKKKKYSTINKDKSPFT